MPKWYIARDVTNKKIFNNFDAAMKWARNLEAANNIRGEIMFENKNGLWTLYW